MSIQPLNDQNFYCEKCHKTMKGVQFYGSNNKEKYPDGKITQCKECLTMHVNPWDSSTYEWILEEIDVPYVPEEWYRTLDKYKDKPEKITGKAILGKYLAKMKMVQYKDYRYKDTEFIREKINKRLEDTMKRQGYSAAEIEQAIESREATGTMVLPPQQPQPQSANVETSSAPCIVDPFGTPPEEDNSIADSLTDEDKTYLRLKWGKAYKPDEWVKLEQFYEEMMSSYDIQGAAHIDTLKLICKTSLKANQLLDMGNIEDYQKMSKVYDTLMKSGKFTAAQNKAEQGEFLDSIGELVELCEKQGYIERFYTETPNDKVDMVIKDMQQYTKNLVEKETNLSTLIEAAVCNNIKEDEANAENNDEISFDDDITELSDEDLIDYHNFLEETEEEDENEEQEGEE